MIRCFLAIDLPEDLRPGLALVQGELKKSQADVRWVPLGNIHITLKFFGNVTDAEVPAIIAAAREVAAEQAPSDPQGHRRRGLPQRPRPPGGVAGAGRGPAAPEPIFSPAGKGLRALDYPPEGRAFNPHLTLGRVRSPEGRAQLSRAAGKTGGGLAALPGAGDYFVSKRAVAQGVDVYAVGSD